MPGRRANVVVPEKSVVVLLVVVHAYEPTVAGFVAEKIALTLAKYAP